MPGDAQGNRDIEELSYTPSKGWQPASPNLSIQASAPNTLGIGLIGFDSSTFSTRQYASITLQGDIEELSLSTQSGATWHAQNLTIASPP